MENGNGLLFPYATISLDAFGVLTSILNLHGKKQMNVPTLVCLIHEQGLISAQGGIYQKINKCTGPNNCKGWKNFRDLKIAAQGLIIAQGKNNYKE